LQEADYTFLKTNYLIIFLVIILFSAVSCRPDTLWDIPLATVKEKLKSADYSFINQIDFKRKSPREVRVLGPGAYFYFSFIFSSLEQGTGEIVYSQNMLLEEWIHGKKLWKDEAGFSYLQALSEKEDYQLLEIHSLQYIKKNKKSLNLTEAKKLYIEALYWQQKDEDVLAALSRYFPETGLLAEEQPELLLFKAVSECRAGAPEWVHTFRDFLVRIESSPLHYRAYQFIILDQERFSALHEDMQQLLIAKSFLGSRYVKPAVPILEMLIKKLDPSFFEDSSLIYELGRVYLSREEYKQGIAYFDGLAHTIEGKGRLDALEMAGRLARKDDKDAQGARYLKPVFQNTTDPLQRDRAAWFYLDCVLELSSTGFTQELVSYAPRWEDPGYFDDIIQKGISVLIGEKKWNHLESFFRDIEPYVSPAIQTQLNYLAARFMILGYSKQDSSSMESEIKTRLTRAYHLEPYNYYGLLASALLKKHPLSLDKAKENTSKESHREKDDNGEAIINITSPADEFVRGFFEYGLVEQGYTYLIKYYDTINDATLFMAVKALQEHGFYKKSIWLMNRLGSKKEYQLTVRELEHSYPLAFYNIIEENAKKREFFTPFFYALIREESAFDQHNASRVGAVGLTQLMPATAGDIAGWLRLDEYDLLDPESNIYMGAYYYSRLLRLLGSVPKTLIAYNAGLGRLRQWEKAYTGFPPDLFIEALPYRETRHYIRKITMTACMYGFLYYNKEPWEVLSLFYPHMF
jgi:hypothetical protein